MQHYFLKFTLALAFLAGTAHLATAQSPEHMHNVYLGAGFSLVGGLFDLGSGGDTINTSSSPALQLNYDYGVSKVVSIGFSFSTQRFGIDVNDFQYEDPNTNMMTTSSFDGSINRTNLAARVLFHYGNKGKLDMYSGIRLGMTRWGANIDFEDEDFVENELGVSPGFWAFAPQLIPFALRYYPAANVGISFETAIGSPHLFSTGLNYRF